MGLLTAAMRLLRAGLISTLLGFFLATGQVQTGLARSTELGLSRSIASGLSAAGAGHVSSIRDVDSISDLTFLDQRQGWLLAVENNGRYGMAVLHTTDGGTSWSTLPVSPVLHFADVSRMVFADARDGWLYGPDLVATRDGGKTWRAESQSHPIVALTVIGQSAWALQQQCKSDDPVTCATTLLRTTAPAWRWKSASRPIPGLTSQLS